MPTMRGDAMRGLAVFISDIRNCKKIDNEIHQFNYALHLGKSREAELRRINKELTNIRQRFRSRRSFSQYFRIFSSLLIQRIKLSMVIKRKNMSANYYLSFFWAMILILDIWRRSIC